MFCSPYLRGNTSGRRYQSRCGLTFSKYIYIRITSLTWHRELVLVVVAPLTLKNRRAIIRNLLSGAIHAPDLHSFRCHFQPSASDKQVNQWPELISALANFPSLYVLELNGCRWWVAGPIQTAPKNLVEYRYIRSHQSLAISVNARHRDPIEARSICSLAIINSATLTTLTLPGEMARFDMLGSTIWPALTQVVILGFPPVKSYAPLIAWLRPHTSPTCPVLHTLKVRLGHVANEQRFMIFPPTYAGPGLHNDPEDGMETRPAKKRKLLDSSSASAPSPKVRSLWSVGNRIQNFRQNTNPVILPKAT